MIIRDGTHSLCSGSFGYRWRNTAISGRHAGSRRLVGDQRRSRQDHMPCRLRASAVGSIRGNGDAPCPGGAPFGMTMPDTRRPGNGGLQRGGLNRVWTGFPVTVSDGRRQASSCTHRMSTGTQPLDKTVVPTGPPPRRGLHGRCSAGVTMAGGETVHMISRVGSGLVCLIPFQQFAAFAAPTYPEDGLY